MIRPVSSSEVLDFVLGCMNQLQAGGYVGGFPLPGPAQPPGRNLPLASVVVFVSPPLPRFSICTSALTMTSPAESRTVPVTFARGA